MNHNRENIGNSYNILKGMNGLEKRGKIAKTYSDVLSLVIQRECVTYTVIKFFKPKTNQFRRKCILNMLAKYGDN